MALQPSKPYNPNNDVEAAVLDDSVSSLAWCPVADLLAASTWSNKVGLWEINRQTGQCMQKHVFSHDAPVLTTGWSADGARLFSAGCDRQVKMTDMATGQTMAIGQHDGPVSCMKPFVSPQMGQLLLTGSWDKTLKYWDLRQPTPALNVPVNDRVYCLDVVFPLLCVGQPDRNILIFNLNNPTQLFKKMESLLKYPSRCIAAFPNQNGFAAGSIEGRVTIQNFEEPPEEPSWQRTSSSDPSKPKKSFSFRCHREPDKSAECYAVNAIVFHPSKAYAHVFATVGSDGWLNIWDKDGQSRLYRTAHRVDNSITTTAFNSDGTLLAYTNSYDWHKGHSQNLPSLKNMILVKAITEDMIRKKPKT